MTLNEDGSISGAATGTWQQAEETAAATFKINNVTYQGYFAAEYDESTGNRVMVFTAIGNNNQTIWGAQTRAWSGTERVIKPITYEDGRYIKSLTVHDKTNARNWSVQTEPKQTGSTIFGDRAFTFTQIPQILDGAEWITTACGSKLFADAEASFIAGADITVYTALDSRVTDIPAWLGEWELTDSILTDDGAPGVTYRLYKKDYAADEIVTLGVLAQSSCVNYTVAVTEQKSEPVVIIGDINADGICDTTDLVMMQKYLLTMEQLTTEQFAAADLNQDGSVTAVDLTLLKRILRNES